MTEESDHGVINSSTLDGIRSLQTEGSADILTRIIDLFLVDTSKQLTQMRHGLTVNNVKAVHDIAHSLKSSSANLGAVKLSSLFNELEEKTRKGLLLGIEDLMGEITKEFNKVQVALQKERVLNESS